MDMDVTTITPEHAKATAQVFLTAFQALPEETRARILAGLIKERVLLEDVLDGMIIEERRNEPTRPLEEFLNEAGIAQE
jgi:hypothetical protein